MSPTERACAQRPPLSLCSSRILLARRGVHGMSTAKTGAWMGCDNERGKSAGRRGSTRSGNPYHDHFGRWRRRCRCRGPGHVHPLNHVAVATSAAPALLPLRLLRPPASAASCHTHKQHGHKRIHNIIGHEWKFLSTRTKATAMSARPHAINVTGRESTKWSPN
jgi:hypothetical protein